MNKYFLDTPSFTKIAGIKLPDATRWDETILSIFAQNFPNFAPVATLTFTKMNEKSQDAIGHIQVDLDQKMKLSFPVIVRHGELSPLDVFAIDGKVYPATRLDEVTREYEKIGTLVSRPRIILVKIATTIPKAEKEQFFRKIATDPDMENAFRDKIGLLYDFAKTPKVSLESNVTEEPVMRLKKIADGDVIKYKIYSYNKIVKDGQYCGEEVTKEVFDKMASDLNVQDCFCDNECTVISPNVESKRKRIKFEKEAKSKFLEDNKTDFFMCEAMSSDGRATKGWKFNKVFDFNGNKVPASLFVGEVFNGMQEKIAAAPISTSPNPLMYTKELGKGVFVKRAVNNDMQVSIPVTLISKRTVGDMECYKGIDGKGTAYNFAKVAGLKDMKIGKRTNELYKYFSAGNVNYIPDSWKFFAIQNEFVKLTESPSTLEKKGAKNTSTDLTIIYRKYNNTYIIKGDIRNCVTEDTLGKHVRVVSEKNVETTLPDDAAELFLIQCGMSSGEARKYLTDAKANEKVSIYVNIEPEAKKPEAIPEEKVAEWVLSIKRDLVKEASVMPDEDSADKLLSLNFVTNENLPMIINSLYEFEDIERRLASMLIAARIGAITISEAALQRALTSMGDVVNKLKEMKFVATSSDAEE